MDKLKSHNSTVALAPHGKVEDLIVAAFHDAKKKVSDHAEAEMHKLTGGLNLPGGMKLPF